MPANHLSRVPTHKQRVCIRYLRATPLGVQGGGR